MAKILAIDDSAENLLALSALRKDLIPECLIITATSGPEGIEKARIQMPDTILVDIKMPGVEGGLELCRNLKSDPQTRNIPIIILADEDTGPESRIKGLDMGADAFLTKPVDSGELAAQLRALLRIKSAQDGLHHQLAELDRLVQDRTRALRSTERHYKTLFNSTNDAIFIQDLEGRFLEVNEEACKRLGYTQEELLEMGPADVEAPEYASLLPQRFEKLGKVGHAIFTTAHVACNGKLIPTEVSSKLIEYDGKPYLLSIARDISERVQAEKERESLQAQLRQAQKMEAIGTLAGGIAHDFNNILAAIMGYTELAMVNTDRESPVRRDLEQVFQAGKRAKGLVEQILTFSRQSETEVKHVQVSLIVKEAIRLLRASLPSTITILQKVDPEAGTVKADPTLIHQVVMNLCTNAFHAMRETGGKLEISLDSIRIEAKHGALHPRLKAGSYVRLTVCDNGHGINPEILDRIFDPFFTTKRRGEGTGMGLSVVHGIVTGCGGLIEVSSTPGEGSTFVVYFPKTFMQEQRTSEPSDALARGVEHILLVDDENCLVEMNREMLERLGYKVTATTNSVEALEVFKSSPGEFDLIVTDQIMPHLTGLQLSEGIMNIRRDIPVILCTGFSELLRPDRIKACGIRELLLKPIVYGDMAAVIRKVLDGASNTHQCS